MSDQEEISPSGVRIIRYAERYRDFEAAWGSEDLPQIDAHLKEYLGEVGIVWHEAVSDLVHVDVHHVAPTPERDFHTIVTTGMSDRPMTVPEGGEEYRYAELMMYLPASWPLPTEVGRVLRKADASLLWPVQLLRLMARFPHRYQTWLGLGHTADPGNPPTPLGPGTELCSILLLPPMLEAEEFTSLKMRPDKTVHFYQVMPIYREERQFKLDRGLDALLERFDQAGVPPVLDANRPNACAREDSALPAQAMNARAQRTRFHTRVPVCRSPPDITGSGLRVSLSPSTSK